MDKGRLREASISVCKKKADPWFCSGSFGLHAHCGPSIAQNSIAEWSISLQVLFALYGINCMHIGTAIL